MIEIHADTASQVHHCLSPSPRSGRRPWPSYFIALFSRKGKFRIGRILHLGEADANSGRAITRKSMNDAQQIVGDAKRAFQRRDYTQALELAQSVDISRLLPIDKIRVLRLMGQSLHALGHKAESTAKYVEAYATARAHEILSEDPSNAFAFDLALILSIGARDIDTVGRLLKSKFPNFFSTPREVGISPVISLQKWCRRHGIPVETMDAAENIAFYNAAGASAIQYQTEPTWHVTIENAEILCGWDFVLSPSGEVLQDANYQPIDVSFDSPPHIFYPPLGLVAHIWSSRQNHVETDALFLSMPVRHHYGHWIADFLPRLRAWSADAPRKKLVISSRLPAKHRELLKRFGVSQDDLLECEIGQRYKFRSLTVVQAGIAAKPNPHNARFLFNKLAPASPASSPQDVFFLERNTGTRLPHNRNELDDLLREFGVAVANPARLSLQQQEQLLGNAKAIIGVYGTELYCLFNLRPGSTVIELATETSDANVYGPTCSFLGINHYRIDCKNVSRTAAGKRKIDSNFIVDCAELRRCLRSVTGRA